MVAVAAENGRRDEIVDAPAIATVEPGTHAFGGDPARRFIDEHLMQWLPRFAGRVTERASTRFYAALAGLTLQVVESLQQRLPASG